MVQVVVVADHNMVVVDIRMHVGVDDAVPVGVAVVLAVEVHREVVFDIEVQVQLHQSGQ